MITQEEILSNIWAAATCRSLWSQSECVSDDLLVNTYVFCQVFAAWLLVRGAWCFPSLRASRAEN